jgi:hypothetical protein
MKKNSDWNGKISTSFIQSVLPKITVSQNFISHIIVKKNDISKLLYWAELTRQRNKSNDNDNNKLGSFKISRTLFPLCNSHFFSYFFSTNSFSLLSLTPHFQIRSSLSFFSSGSLHHFFHFNTTPSSFSCKFLNFSYLGTQKYLSFPLFIHY